MSNTKIYYCGENGITYKLFSELTAKGKLNRLLHNITWEDETLKDELLYEKIISVYLFPCFGRRHGPGEPDAIIKTEKHNIFFELETCEFKKLPKHFFRQMNSFIDIGFDISYSPRKSMRKKNGYKWISNKRTKGFFRNRKLFKDLLGSGKEPLFVVIAEGDLTQKNDLFSNDKNKLPVASKKFFGFINYYTVKRMKGKLRIAEIINFNLKA